MDVCFYGGRSFYNSLVECLMKQLIKRWEIWSLHYRAEILWFGAGVLLGLILGAIVI